MQGYINAEAVKPTVMSNGKNKIHIIKKYTHINTEYNPTIGK